MKRILLLNFFLFAALSLGLSQTTYFSEDLESGIPAGWTVTGDWQYGPAASLASAYAPFGSGTNLTNIFAFNDDALGQNHAGGGRVITAPIDLTAVTGAIFVEFEFWFANLDFGGANETAKVSISKDNGATWDLIGDLPGLPGWYYIPYDISSYAGETIQLAFDYDDGGGWNYFYCLDNISIVDDPTLSTRRSYTFSINGGPQFDQVLLNHDYQVEGVVTNTGYETINSFDVIVTEGTDVETFSFDGYDIVVGQAATYELPTTYKADAFRAMTFEISNVNGETTPDEDVSNNSADLVLSPVAGIHPDKAVFVEEATGTWCTWCPRGTVYMDEMKKRFGKHFAGVAVHNGQNDPMVLPEYDSGMGAILMANNGGYPSVYFNRQTLQNPDAIVSPSISVMQAAPAAKLEVGVDLDGIIMSTSISVNFLEDMDDDFRVLIVLTEDELQGEGTGWAQTAGAYSGGGNGPMGGFEYLPGSVPAAVWPYDHVNRAILGGFDGKAGEFSGAFPAGSGDSYIFPDYVLAPSWEIDNMHIVGVLLDGQGRVVNAVSSKLNDAIALGTTGIEEEIDVRYLDVYPNPVANTATISLALEVSKSVKVTLTNALGQKVSSANYGTISGNQKLDYNTSELNQGIYYLNIQIDDEVITRRIVKS